MEWGEIELEPEVKEWLCSLPRRHFPIAEAHIDRLAEAGALLGEPLTRQLEGKLRELRFSLEGNDWRISYFIVSGRRIILLTVFRKTRRREASQIRRAVGAMRRCIAAGHVLEEDDD